MITGTSKPIKTDATPTNFTPLNGHVGNGSRALKPKGVPLLNVAANDDEDEGEGDRECYDANPGGSLASLELDEDAGDGFLVGCDDDSDGDDTDVTHDGDIRDVGFVANDWVESEAYEIIYQPGSKLQLGNLNSAIPKWVLHYFQNPEKALLFAQILYWFGPNNRGTPRASRRDDLRRRVLDKTHQEFTDELGLENSRRVEGLLKSFLDNNLLDYDPCHGTGKGRATRIWLKPAGILAAYRLGCRRAEEAERRLHDKCGGT